MTTVRLTSTDVTLAAVVWVDMAYVLRRKMEQLEQPAALDAAINALQSEGGARSSIYSMAEHALRNDESHSLVATFGNGTVHVTGYTRCKRGPTQIPAWPTRGFDGAKLS